MREVRRGVRGIGVVAAATMILTLGQGPMANASVPTPGIQTVAAPTAQTPGLPPGWTLEGPILTWTSPERVPIGGARLEVLVGDRPLGLGVLSRDQRSVSVKLSPDVVADQSVDWSALALQAAGRRLDTTALDSAAREAAPSQDPLAALPDAGKLVADDPGRPGPYRTVTGEYALPGVAISGLSEKVEVRAVVVSPRGTGGERPLILFLHGRHSTCYRGADESTGDWPCPAGYQAIPSHRGYLETQELLASQGYVTVSISANGINGQDWVLADGGAEARSELIRHHLGLWARWSRSGAAQASAPAVVRAAPRADLDRVLLVGHSRGGEGVNRVALDSTTGTAVDWTIKGVVHIGPTAFGQNPAPGVPAVVLLPYCDGDVFDLQGQAYVDAARDAGKDPVLRSAVMVIGANHNFFNSEWTPGDAVAPAWDDWWDDSDRVCGTRPGSTRLTAAAQRQVGTTYVAAAAAVFLAADESALPLLDGTGAHAASTGSARIRTHALGARRATLLVPNSTTSLTSSGGVTARLCRTAEASNPRHQCPQDAFSGADPHFLPLYYLPGEPSRRAVDVAWAKAGGTVRIDLPDRRNLARARALELRVIVPAGAKGTTFGVRITDDAGRRLVLADTTLQGLPRTSAGMPGKNWAQSVRLVLDGAAVPASRIDLTAITRVDVLTRSAGGRLWLLDAWGWQPGLSQAAPLRLSRLDVGVKTVNEGSRTRTVRVPLTVTGPARTAGRVWVVVIDPTSFETPVGRLVTVPVGSRRLTLDLTVPGDRRDDPDALQYQVAVKAVKGLAIGDYLGGLTVLDDDPSPTLSVVPVSTTVEEGTDLVWRFQLSEATDFGVYVGLMVVAPGPDLPPEVDTADISRDWLADHGVDLSAPRRPLSEASPWAEVYIEPGTDHADLVIPTRVDSRAEGSESVAILVVVVDKALWPDPDVRVEGTLTDAA